MKKLKHLHFPPSSMEFYYLTGTFHLGDHKHCFRHGKAYSLYLPVVFWSIFLYMSVQAWTNSPNFRPIFRMMRQIIMIQDILATALRKIWNLKLILNAKKVSWLDLLSDSPHPKKRWLFILSSKTKFRFGVLVTGTKRHHSQVISANC